MRLLYLSILFSIPMPGICQEYDSSWVAETYFTRFTTDTGNYLAPAVFVDEKGKQKTLADFKGKILYINIWTTWCGPCRLDLQRSHQLLQRLQSIHIDTSILFINICTEDSRRAWKKRLKELDPPGVNLYSPDTMIYQSWAIESFPTAILLDASGKIMAKKFTDARDALLTDFLLYEATKGIKPAEAIWIDFRQNYHNIKNRSYTNDNEGREYAAWFNSLADLFYAHHLANLKSK